MKTNKIEIENAAQESQFASLVQGVLRHFREYYLRARQRDNGPLEAASTVGEATLDETQKAIWTKLSEWRREEARKRGVPVYLVLNNLTLFALAAKPPRSLEALAEVPGIGPRKLADLGAKVLELLDSVSDPSTSDTSSGPSETP